MIVYSYLVVYSVSLRFQSKCGKIRTRITPDTDTFYLVHLIFVSDCLLKRPHKSCRQSYSFLLPSKHSSWPRRTEDIFSVIFFCLPISLEDVLKTSSRHNCKTSWNCLEEDVLQTHLEDILGRRLEDIFGRCIANTSWRLKIVTLKTSWRRLGKQKMLAG